VSGSHCTPLALARDGKIVCHRNPRGVRPFGLHYHGIMATNATGVITRMCSHQHRLESTARRCHEQAPPTFRVLEPCF
jgi:hypothetical protein